MTSKQKNINQLRSDKFVGKTPAQFLHEDRWGTIAIEVLKPSGFSKGILPRCAAIHLAIIAKQTG